MIQVLENIEKYSFIFEAVPGHNALLQVNPPIFTILAVTEDFLSNSGTTKEQLVGRGIFECFPSNPTDPKDTGQKSLLASFQWVIKNKEPHQLEAQRYDVPDEKGNFTERYWVAKNKPVLNEEGDVIYIIHTAEEITFQVKAKKNEEMMKSMEHASNLFKQAPVAISILKGKDFIIELANDKMIEIYGKNNQVIHQPIAKVLPELEAQGHIDLLNNVLRTKRLYYGYESPLTIIENGQEKLKYYNFVYQPYYEESDVEPTGVLAFVNEVTDKISIKTKLYESEERFRIMAEGTEVLIAMADETSSATYFNNAWTELTGRPMEDLLKFGWVDLVHPDDRERFVNIYLSAFEQRKPFKGEFRILDSNGQYRWLLAKGPVRFRADGSFAGYISSCIDITERKQAETDLQDSEQRIRSIVESAPFPIGVYIGKEMKIALANQSIINVWGKGANVIGKLYTEILPELSNQEIFGQLQDVLTTGIPFHAKNQRVDIVIEGILQSFYFNYSFTPLFNSAGKVYGVMNTAADVTDLNLAKKQIEDSEAQLRSLVMSAPIGICIVKGKEMIPEVVNDSFLEVCGRSREAFINLPYWKVLPELASAYAPILENVMNTGIMYRGDDREVKLIRNGREETLYVNFVYDPVKESDGAINRVMIVAIEVTEQVMARRKIEEIIAERTKELAEANHNLKRSNEELAQFAYIASHDLQEPLRKVSTFSQMLEQSLPEVNDRAKGFLAKINNSTARMTNLIKDVLAYSQLSKEKEVYEWVNLNGIVEWVKNDFELLIEQKQATIESSGLPTIQAIPLQMSQLVTNLISNALKFTIADTKPMISIKATIMTKEEVTAHSLNNDTLYYNIEFKDNGIGFGQEHATRIFSIFQRLHGKSEFSGTGIGLAMCKKIAQNHHGDIYATAVKGSGAVFNVILPERQVG